MRVSNSEIICEYPVQSEEIQIIITSHPIDFYSP